MGWCRSRLEEAERSALFRRKRNGSDTHSLMELSQRFEEVAVKAFQHSCARDVPGAMDIFTEAQEMLDRLGALLTLQLAVDRTPAPPCTNETGTAVPVLASNPCAPAELGPQMSIAAPCGGGEEIAAKAAVDLSVKSSVFQVKPDTVVQPSHSKAAPSSAMCCWDGLWRIFSPA